MLARTDHSLLSAGRLTGTRRNTGGFPHQGRKCDPARKAPLVTSCSGAAGSAAHARIKHSGATLAVNKQRLAIDVQCHVHRGFNRTQLDHTLDRTREGNRSSWIKSSTTRSGTMSPDIMSLIMGPPTCPRTRADNLNQNPGVQPSNTAPSKMNFRASPAGRVLYPFRASRSKPLAINQRRINKL